jgi:hypothetical protein
MQKPNQNELWRPVVGFEGLYEVSNKGRVRSLPNKGRPGRVLRFITQKVLPYRRVNLCNGTQHGRFVHHLVLAAFVGPRPAGAHTRHLNSDPTDNRPENLAYGSPLENYQDRVARGTARLLDKVKLTKDDIVEIRRRVRNGRWGILSRLAEKYGVNVTTIMDIRDLKTWAHVTDVTENKPPDPAAHV